MCASPGYLRAHPPLTHPRELSQHSCIAMRLTGLDTEWTLTGPEGELTVPVRASLLCSNAELAHRAALADWAWRCWAPTWCGPRSKPGGWCMSCRNTSCRAATSAWSTPAASSCRPRCGPSSISGRRGARRRQDGRARGGAGRSLSALPFLLPDSLITAAWLPDCRGWLARGTEQVLCHAQRCYHSIFRMT